MKKSINDLTLTGLSKLDLSSLARVMVSNRFVGIADVSKFYNQVFVCERDFPQQLFCWRQNGIKENPIQVFCFTRLMFGNRCAATVDKFGLSKICQLGESYCSHCGGLFSVTNPEISKGGRCYGISHYFARCMSKIYVDDATEPVLKNLIEYANMTQQHQLYLTWNT